jgi:hypothetical protein
VKADVESFLHNVDQSDTVEPSVDEYMDAEITPDEILYVVKKLKTNKSPGMDGILNEVIASTVDIIMPHIVKLFNGILNGGTFPTVWTEGIIVPLFKKGDANDVNNYRGITLLSCLGKVFTGVLCQRIEQWVVHNDKVSDAQFGFKKGYSTTDAMFILHNLIVKYVGEKRKLYCAFVDFRKAFDSVYRNGLWEKLYNLGLRGKVWSVLRNMYKVVKSCVRVNNVYSKSFECDVGLRQGEILSPILFSLFIEDLENSLQENVCDGIIIENITLFLLLFADDAVLLSETPDGLQRSLDTLAQYCKEWGLAVNCEKTKIMVFKRGPIPTNVQWTYEGKVLEIVGQFNYLGTTFSSGGTYNINYQTLAGKGLKAMNVLMSMVRSYKFKPDILCQLFDAFVTSIMCYGAEIWGFKKVDVIERVQLKFFKRMLGVKVATSTAGVYGEVGRYPVWIRWLERIVRYWFKSMTTDNCILSVICKFTCNSSNNNCWGQMVKSMLCKYGFNDVWMYPLSVNVNVFVPIFKRRVKDCFLQGWHCDVKDCKPLLTYCCIKIDHAYEGYLNNVVNMKHRIALSKLRLSSSSLRIETGRHGSTRVDRSLRTCEICNSTDIEDEFNFVLICPCYGDLKTKIGFIVFPGKCWALLQLKIVICHIGGGLRGQCKPCLGNPIHQCHVCW